MKSNAHDDAGIKAKSSPKKSRPTTGDRGRKSDRDPQTGKFAKGNSRAFKKGQSGNPKGRPPGYLALSEAYRKALQQKDPKDPEGRTYVEVIAEMQVRAAAGYTLESSTNAAKEIADRTEGKARQAVDLGVKGEALNLLAMMLGVTVEELPPPAS